MDWAGRFFCFHAKRDPTTLISQQAVDQTCDLIVIATNDRSASAAPTFRRPTAQASAKRPAGASGTLGRALIGSVADHVIRNTSTAAVLVIRPEA